jgi:hypothetical protein
MLPRSLKLLGLIALSTYGPFVLIYALSIAGIGWVIAGVEVFVCIPMGALVVAAMALPGLAFKRFRQQAVPAAVVSAGLVALFVPTLLLASKARMFGFYLASKRAEPIVAAVHAYVKEHGAPPSTLEELTSHYLERLPARLPDLKLVVGDEARSRFEGNDWVLFSVVSTGILNWDQFMYFPQQNYPTVGHGGWIERVGEWAYVHE